MSSWILPTAPDAVRARLAGTSRPYLEPIRLLLVSLAIIKTSIVSQRVTLGEIEANGLLRIDLLPSDCRASTPDPGVVAQTSS
jgi:hypothetical protein